MEFCESWFKTSVKARGKTMRLLDLFEQIWRDVQNTFLSNKYKTVCSI